MANLGQTRAKGAKAYQGQQIVDRNSLVIKYAPLVKRVALHLKNRLPGSVDVNDLIQAGMIGLIESIQHYKEGQGAVFETYASIRIKGAMLDDLRQSDWTPRGVHQNTRAIRESMTRLAHRYGRPATDVEIAADLKVDINRYHQMLLDSTASQVVGIEDTGLTEDVISESGADVSYDKLFEDINDTQFKAALQHAIETLPERESKIVSFYYDQELNLREIGLILGISESRTCQILSQALMRVRAKLSEWGVAQKADKDRSTEENRRVAPIAPGAVAVETEAQSKKESLLFDENGEITMRTAQGAAAEAKRQIEQHTLTSQAVRTTSDGKTVIESVGEAREDRAADSAPKTTRTRGRLAGSASSKSARGRGHAVDPATADAAQGTDGQTTGTRRRGRPRKAAQMQIALAKANAAAASVNAAVKDVASVADVATK